MILCCLPAFFGVSPSFVRCLLAFFSVSPRLLCFSFSLLCILFFCVCLVLFLVSPRFLCVFSFSLLSSRFLYVVFPFSLLSPCFLCCFSSLSFNLPSYCLFLLISFLCVLWMRRCASVCRVGPNAQPRTRELKIKDMLLFRGRVVDIYT